MKVNSDKNKVMESGGDERSVYEAIIDGKAVNHVSGFKCIRLV